MTTNKTKYIFKSIDEIIQTLTAPDRFYVVLYDPDRSELSFPWVTQDEKNIHWESRPYNHRLLPDKLISEKRSQLIETDGAGQIAEGDFIYWPDEHPPKSWLGAPIIFEDRVLGVIVVESQKSNHFGERGLRVVTTIARQTAAAIENARLYDRLNRKIKDLDAVNKIGQRLTTAIQLDENAILKLIHEQAGELMDTNNMFIALYDEETRTVRFPIMFINGKPIDVEPRQSGRGLTEWIICNNKPLILLTKEEIQTYYTKKESEKYFGISFASWLGVPMRVGENVLGVIATYHLTKNFAFSNYDLEILQAIADQAAIAIDNVRLVRQERERGEALKLLNQVSEKSNATLNMNEVMASIVEGAMRLTGASSGVVHLLKENELSLERSFGYPKDFDHPAPRLDQPDSMTRTIIEDGELIFRQKSEEEYQLHSEIVKKGVESIIGAPLILQGEVVGVLYLNFDHQYSFGEEVRTWLDTLTEQAAVATDKIRLYETLEEKVRERTRQLEKTNAELKATKEQSVRNSLSAMSGGYVHRLNGALGFIPASLNFIKDQLDSDAQKILDDVYSGVSEALAYTKRMTNLFTGQELPRERIQVNLLLQTVVKNLPFPSTVTKILKLDPDIPEIMTDKMFLTEVFYNLIINALESMQGQPEGRLEIGSKFDENNGIVKIWFSDTGCGITRENFNKLYDPQFTTKPDKHGSKRGIGLWFSKTVIDTLSGSINVESVPGEGTTFTITLPVGDN